MKTLRGGVEETKKGKRKVAVICRASSGTHVLFSTELLRGQAQCGWVHPSSSVELEWERGRLGIDRAKEEEGIGHAPEL